MWRPWRSCWWSPPPGFLHTRSKQWHGRLDCNLATFAIFLPFCAVFSILFARLIFPAIEQMRPCSPVAWWCWNSRQADHKRARHHSNPRPPLSTQMLDQTYNLSLIKAWSKPSVWCDNMMLVGDEDVRLVRHICGLHTWHCSSPLRLAADEAEEWHATCPPATHASRDPVLSRGGSPHLDAVKCLYIIINRPWILVTFLPLFLLF